MSHSSNARENSALALLSSHRPRNVPWWSAAGLLFGDWGTSRLYVLGLAFFFASRSSFYLILAMSALILAVGWAYSQICRIYADGGGVYTAAKSRSKLLAVVGALLLFADYTVTASLSALDAFHYFGLPLKPHVQAVEQHAEPEKQIEDAGDLLRVKSNLSAEASNASTTSQDPTPVKLFQWDSPGLWAMVAIMVIGLFNLMGPGHTGHFAFAAAVGMILITLLIFVGGIFSIQWAALPSRIGTLQHPPGEMWIAFVSIVLALSGVEAIANLTGVMKHPVAHTARKAIWVVALEVAIFNVILALFMCNVFPLSFESHKEDMLAFLAGHYIGHLGEWLVRILGGILLLSATNTAITDMISVQYLMARDGELPYSLQSLNRFGVPWIPAVIAASVPVLVLLFSHDLEKLAALYAIGVIGAVAINVTLCAFHPRLRRLHRKGPMVALGIVLLIIWVTLAFTKHTALLFVLVVMAIGLSARALTRWYANRSPKPTLLRQAIIDQLPPDFALMPKIMIGTYGSVALAQPAMEIAKKEHAALLVCFVRQVSLSMKWDQPLSIDDDLAAKKTFIQFLELGAKMNVPIIPSYDAGSDAVTLLAECAAVNAASKILLGSSRRGAFYKIVKGEFQKKLEALIPPEIPIQVVTPEEHQ